MVDGPFLFPSVNAFVLHATPDSTIGTTHLLPSFSFSVFFSFSSRSEEGGLDSSSSSDDDTGRGILQDHHQQHYIHTTLSPTGIIDNPSSLLCPPWPNSLRPRDNTPCSLPSLRHLPFEVSLHSLISSRPFALLLRHTTPQISDPYDPTGLALLIPWRPSHTFGYLCQHRRASVRQSQRHRQHHYRVSSTHARTHACSPPRPIATLTDGKDIVHSLKGICLSWVKACRISSRRSGVARLTLDPSSARSYLHGHWRSPCRPIPARLQYPLH